MAKNVYYIKINEFRRRVGGRGRELEAFARKCDIRVKTLRWVWDGYRETVEGRRRHGVNKSTFEKICNFLNCFPNELEDATAATPPSADIWAYRETPLLATPWALKLVKSKKLHNLLVVDEGVMLYMPPDLVLSSTDADFEGPPRRYHGELYTHPRIPTEDGLR